MTARASHSCERTVVFMPRVGICPALVVMRPRNGRQEDSLVHQRGREPAPAGAVGRARGRAGSRPTGFIDARDRPGHRKGCFLAECVHRTRKSGSSSAPDHNRGRLAGLRRGSRSPGHASSAPGSARGRVQESRRARRDISRCGVICCARKRVAALAEKSGRPRLAMRQKAC